MIDIKHIYKTKKQERDKFIAALNPKSFDFQIVAWFGSGLIIPASGTWGTIGGMIFGIPLLLLTNSLVVFITALILFFVGLKSIERIEKKLPDHDSAFIVIDEVVAILLLISQLPKDYLFISAPLVFLLFRFFDAKKPWLIGLADRKIKGAWGVMIDDIVAAIFTLITFWVILFIFIIYIMS
jgi:phosphatidylglycerophosphatase A